MRRTCDYTAFKPMPPNGRYVVNLERPKKTASIERASGEVPVTFAKKPKRWRPNCPKAISGRSRENAPC